MTPSASQPSADAPGRATPLRLLAAAALIAAGAALAPAATARAQVTPPEATALGQQAYLYGFPLLEFLRVRATATSVRCPDVRGNSPVNSFSNARRFANPSSRTVVAPNVDTLYSIAHLDLGRGPVVLSHPNMGRRYFVFQLLDPYTNTIGYVGSRTTGSKAGSFAITWRGRRGRKPAGARMVRSPSRRVWVIGRTLARGKADQRRAFRLMRRYRLAPPGGPRRFAKGCRPGRPKQARTPSGPAFLNALGRALRQNPPPARDRPLLARLATVGVGPGLRPERAGLGADTLAALVESVDATAELLPEAVRSSLDGQAAENDGWAIPRDNIGDYGTDYQYRAGVALAGLGANTREEAVYPTALRDAAGAPLDGRSSYRIVFREGEAPPARAFWSLTLYDADGYLVPNPQRRYAIGDSHPPLVRRRDGSIVIVLQRSKPGGAGINWLPTPAGPFRLNLRIYEPRASVLSGAWRPPPVVRAAG
jgi:hypothetical protein